MERFRPRGPYHRQGAHKRWFWRIYSRMGDYWARTPDREIAKLLRQWSWRRP